MKLTPSAYRLAMSARCSWKDCVIPATFGVRIVMGGNHDAYRACEVHFPKLYDRIQPDGTFWSEYGMECDPPYDVRPL